MKKGLIDMVCKYCLFILDLFWVRFIFSLLVFLYFLVISFFKFFKRFWSDKLKFVMFLFRVSIIFLFVWIFFIFNIKRS